MVAELRIGHKYKVLKHLDITTDLEKFKRHRRLSVFYHKGLICANPQCNKEGKFLIMGEAPNRGIHVDVYTENLELMTVDHILPKSKGGSMTLDNLRPMCKTCNTKRGNKLNYVY